MRYRLVAFDRFNELGKLYLIPTGSPPYKEAVNLDDVPFLEVVEGMERIS
jgi:hypothetical protein